MAEGGRVNVGTLRRRWNSSLERGEDLAEKGITIGRAYQKTASGVILPVKRNYGYSRRGGRFFHAPLTCRGDERERDGRRLRSNFWGLALPVASGATSS